MNPIPTSSIHARTCSGSSIISIPSASRTSAEPDFDETALFPCFATAIPAPAATKAEIVLILNVFILSPPVPQVSTITPDTFGEMIVAYRNIARVNETISSTVSPFILNPVKKEAICASVALPLIISSITSSASSGSRSILATIFEIASFIIRPNTITNPANCHFSLYIKYNCLLFKRD